MRSQDRGPISGHKIQEELKRNPECSPSDSFKEAMKLLKENSRNMRKIIAELKAISE